jgi:multidrug efflux system membrane fusion protein
MSMDSTVSPDKVSKPQQKRTRRARIIGSIIAVLAMIGLGALAWHLTHQAPAAGAGQGAAGPGARGQGGGGGGGRGGRGGPATTVGVATAVHADIPVVIDALGTVTAAATATVRPQVSGVLQKINFTEGQFVKQGQVLATIDARPFQMSLLQAQGQRQRDEAQLESARVTLQRYRTLLAQDSIARQEVDTQAALVKQLEGTVMTDRAAEGNARLNVGYTQVRAPISGRVGLRTVDIGNLVGSGDANGVAVITQLAPIDVEFAVPQDQVPELQSRAGQGAALQATALDRTRTDTLASGKFQALDNQVDTQTGTVRAKARFANTDSKLFPSQFVNLRLQVRTIKDAVVVPVTALRHGARPGHGRHRRDQERPHRRRTGHHRRRGSPEGRRQGDAAGRPAGGSGRRRGPPRQPWCGRCGRAGRRGCARRAGAGPGTGCGSSECRGRRGAGRARAPPSRRASTMTGKVR